jgi:hypothetical protein
LFVVDKKLSFKTVIKKNDESEMASFYIFFVAL